jgi:hypothetical protein
MRGLSCTGRQDLQVGYVHVLVSFQCQQQFRVVSVGAAQWFCAVLSVSVSLQSDEYSIHAARSSLHCQIGLNG